MTTLAYTNTLTAGQPENVSQVQQNFVDARTVLNGGLDGDNVSTATAQALGLTTTAAAPGGAAVRRGKSIIATAENIAGTSYATLTTPDRVASLVVPSNAIVWVSFWCELLKTVGGAGESGSVGLFFGANQVKSRFGTAPASGVSGGLFEGLTLLSGAGTPQACIAFTDYVDPGISSLTSSSGEPVDDTTNGHPVGAFVPLVIAAGTYTVEMRFKKTAGATVAVSKRRLYCKVEV